MKESQRQDWMRRSSLMPDKDAKQTDSGGNKRGLHGPDLSFAQIDESPHQATAAGAGQKGTGKIESADAMSDALVHSGDYEERSDNRNRHVDQESPAPRNVGHDQRPKKWPGDTRDSPGAAGRAQRSATFVRRINDSEQNKRKSGNGSRSHALDGACANELHHRTRHGAESAPDRERYNTDEIRAPASPTIGARSPDRH